MILEIRTRTYYDSGNQLQETTAHDGDREVPLPDGMERFHSVLQVNFRSPDGRSGTASRPFVIRAATLLEAFLLLPEAMEEAKRDIERDLRGEQKPQIALPFGVDAGRFNGNRFGR